MIDEELREQILELLEKAPLNTELLIKKYLNEESKRVLLQLILLEKNKLLRREIYEDNDPLMHSTWFVTPKWKELLEKEKSAIITPKAESVKDDEVTKLVATIPSEFSDFELGTKIIETREALATLFSSAKSEILISSPYLDEILRLYLPFIKKAAPSELRVRLMTLSQENEYNQQRLQKIITDLKSKFSDTEIIFFEDKQDISSGMIKYVFKTHAKIIIVDEEYLFVTSANLMRTSYLDNFEMGFITKQKELILEAKRLFNYLSEKIKLLP